MDLLRIALLCAALVGLLVLEGCGGDGPSPSPPPPPGPTPAPKLNRTGTTRYWDCSGGTCAFEIEGDGIPCPNKKCNTPFDDGGSPRCNPHSWAPQWVKYNGEKILYAAAAASDWLFCGKDLCENDGWEDGNGCGKCYLLTNPGDCETGDPKLTKIILRTSNLCPGEHNAVCFKSFHFDISAPGFDHASTSTYNVCNNEGNGQNCDPSVFGSDACVGKPMEDCDCTEVSSDQTLIEGCNNFKMLGWDNCHADFQEVSCPEELGVSAPAFGAELV